MESVNFIYIFMGFLSPLPTKVNLGNVQFLAVIIATSGKWIYFYRCFNTITRIPLKFYFLYFLRFSRCLYQNQHFYWCYGKNNTFTVSRQSSRALMLVKRFKLKPFVRLLPLMIESTRAFINLSAPLIKSSGR